MVSLISRRISAIERRFGLTRPGPAGFVVEQTEIDCDCVFLDVRAAGVSGVQGPPPALDKASALQLQ